MLISKSMLGYALLKIENILKIKQCFSSIVDRIMILYLGHPRDHVFATYF